MTTSLAVPGTNRLTKESQIPASVLFSSRQVVNCGRDVIYDIGLTGLEELEELLPEFSKFHSTLFHESSKLLERSSLDESDNKKLDDDISNFLTLVLPFVSLNPAQMALEWLVHRFHIHRYNADELLTCVLPYRGTNIYASVLQILNLKDVDITCQRLQEMRMD